MSNYSKFDFDFLCFKKDSEATGVVAEHLKLVIVSLYKWESYFFLEKFEDLFILFCKPS